MNKLIISRFYIFDPATNLWRAWNGTWTAFKEAQDFLSLVAAEKALEVAVNDPINSRFLTLMKLVRS